jgi:hypothetical protein
MSNKGNNKSNHAAKKATYAYEENNSRKSSRKSANRAKPDAGLTIREEFRRTTPQARHDREAGRR